MAHYDGPIEPLWSSYGKNRYIWFYRCSMKCSLWKESHDPAGERAWSKETCPYDRSPLVEMAGDAP